MPKNLAEAEGYLGVGNLLKEWEDNGGKLPDSVDSAAGQSSDKLAPLPSRNPDPSATARAVGYRAKRGRRFSVSAEADRPVGALLEKKFYAKSEEARAEIMVTIAKNLLFKNLDDAQQSEVVDAMFERKTAADEVIIQQGKDGDNFYVVSSGNFIVYKKTEDSPADSPHGTEVCRIDASGSFGELALMYNTPRAATVVSVGEGSLWAMDRGTFRRILMESQQAKRKLYDSFLAAVPILETLTEYERSTIADALEPVTFQDGETIIAEGETGDSFYILEDGSATVTKNETGDEALKTLKARDYFGEIALLTDEPRAATVTANGKAKCVRLGRKAFVRLLGPVSDLLSRNMDAYNRYASEVSGPATATA